MNVCLNVDDRIGAVLTNEVDDLLIVSCECGQVAADVVYAEHNVHLAEASGLEQGLKRDAAETGDVDRLIANAVHAHADAAKICSAVYAAALLDADGPRIADEQSIVKITAGSLSECIGVGRRLRTRSRGLTAAAGL